jgi:septal ring factor EnvC (AmiA/AmiB activator)
MFSKGECIMLKKVVIAGLAVAVGVAVLAWLSPKLISTIRYSAEQGIEGIENSVPLETEIGRLKSEVKRLENDEHSYYDQVARQAVEVDKLRKDVDDTSVAMDKQWKNIEAMRNDLGDNQKASFKYGARKYSREEVTDQLSRDFKSYENCEKELQAKKDLLSAGEKSLAASEDQLGSLKGNRKDMEVELAKLEADLKLVRMKEAQTSLQVDDNEYARVRSDIAKLRDKVSTKQKAIEYQGKFANGTIDATAAPAEPEEKDLLKMIDQKKNGHKGDGKNVAEEK